MKTVKKILACLLSILTICSCMGIAAFAEEVGGAVNDSVTWSFDTETGVLSINGTGATGNYGLFGWIPQNSPWKSYTDDIREVQIAEGLIRIGTGAFANCKNLTSITIPDSVTSIGDNVFTGTGIYNDASNWTNGVLYIGNHLIKAQDSLSGAYTVKAGTKSIAESAFVHCASLESVTFPDSVKMIEKDAFADCTSLKNITLPEGLTDIGYEAFCGCTALTGVTLPDSLTGLDRSAFDDCTALKTITIPQNVQFEDYIQVEYAPFEGCTSLTHITVDPENPFYSNDANGVLFDKNKTTLLRFPIGSALKEYVVPDGVTNMDPRAFMGCTSLTGITIPHGVTVISHEAFSGCAALTDVSIPDSVTDIGLSAFYRCTNLKGITLPESVTTILDGAFQDCTSLTSITLPESAMYIYYTAFANTGLYNDKTNWTNGVLYIGNHLIRAERSVAGTYMVRPGTKSIAACAFTMCSSLNSIHIPASVSEIGENIRGDRSTYICSDTADCYAKEYADQNDIEFRVCDGSHPEAEMFVDILDNSGKKTLLFWESATFEAFAQNLPADATLVWEVDKPDIVELKPSATGNSCKVTSRRNGTVNLTLKAVHADGREVEGCRSDTVQVRSKTIGIYRIVGFFRYLGDILIFILNNGGCTGFPDPSRLF